MMRIKVALAVGAALLVVTGCSKGDSGAAKTDSAAADSIRDAHDASVADTASASGASATDSARGPINSTEGTIGETRKRARMHLPDTFGHDSVVHGPYKTMDSLGRIKR